MSAEPSFAMTEFCAVSSATALWMSALLSRPPSWTRPGRRSSCEVLFQLRQQPLGRDRHVRHRGLQLVDGGVICCVMIRARNA